MMKYAVNHPWKFRNVTLAFFSGFLQVSISYIIEISNAYIVLANGDSQFEIIANFVVMLVIAEFDNYFYTIREDDIVKRIVTDELYEDMFTWEVSTSVDARAKIKENEM